MTGATTEVSEVVGAPVPAASRSLAAARWAGRIRACLSRARGLWRDFTGEAAYDRYVERHRREHPDHAPLTARQWWRARSEFDESNVSTGCC
ncbi:YbdD/YjiX family protein [Actinomyces sp. 565]|uniref:YbdD/YjiX family protein n=1 Tax=Actinomyces sp. 565 TaxID=2057794 RepID=UPI0031B7F853